MFGVSDQARYKPSCTTIEDGQGLENSDLERRGLNLSRLYHDAAHIILYSEQQMCYQPVQMRSWSAHSVVRKRKMQVLITRFI